MRPGRRTVWAGATAAVLVLTGLVVTQLLPDRAPAPRVEVSSAAPGSLPQDVVDGTGEGWVSDGETEGAWVQLAWTAPVELSEVELRLPDTGAGRVEAGWLTFSDGSRLQVVTDPDAPVTVVAFLARTVERVRFTVSEVTAGASDVRVQQLVARTRDAVVVQPPPGPDLDVAASADLSSSASGAAPLGGSLDASLDALVDGTGAEVGDDWSLADPLGGWVLLTWDRPVEVATVVVAGAPRGARLTSAELVFSDGSRLALGEVLGDPDRPTVVSFMPRSTTSLRVEVDGVSASGPLVLAELGVRVPGARPWGPSGEGTAHPSGAPTVPCPPDAARPGDDRGLVVLCPTSGSTTGAQVDVRVAAGPSYDAVEAVAWSADPASSATASARGTPEPDGGLALVLDAAALPTGLVTLAVTATSPTLEPVVVHLHLDLLGGRPAAPVGDEGADGGADGGHAPPGLSLVFADEFDAGLSVSRTGDGADYTAAKPTAGGSEDFGEAIFGDPAAGLGNLRTVADDYLRISVAPLPEGVADPQGYGRRLVGGLLASARPGGSGFSAQYGYFEARMLLPAAPGTWPAFWLLPSPNLVRPLGVVAEIDAVEHYGHEPTATCATTHQYPDPLGVGLALCGPRWGSAREALSWHTFGVDVSPLEVTYDIDGREIGSAPQVGGGEEPLFFLLDLALGGGWPVDLARTRGRADLYVDWVRVHV